MKGTQKIVKEVAPQLERMRKQKAKDLRTIDRADEIYNAMLLRGFNGDFPNPEGKKNSNKKIT